MRIEIILLLMSQTLNGNVKNCYRKKNVKNNNSNVNLITIATLRKGNNNEQI